MEKNQKKSFWQELKIFFEPVKYVKKEVFFVTLHDGIFQLLTVGIIFFMQYAVDSLSNKNLENFFLRIGIMVFMGLVILLMNIFWRPHLFIVRAKLRNILDQKLMPKIIHGDNNKFETLGTGKIIAIYTKGVGTRADMIVNISGDLFGTVLFFIFFLITIAFKNIILFMIFFLFLIVGVFVFTKFSYLQRKRRKLAKVKDIEKQRIDVKWMMNKNEIMQQDKISYELGLKAKVNYERSNMKKKEKFFQGIVFDGVAFLNTLSVIIIVGVSGWLLHNGNLTYGEITVVVGFGSMFIKETTQLLKSIRSMIDRYIDVVKIQELCKELKSSVDIHSGLSFTYKSGNIKIYNMSFGYEKSPVFQNFNLQIQGGTKTAFVGESGGGKTTLIKLLAGYIRPDSGEIEIDGQKLSEIKLTDYYKHIGYLTQDPSVFDGTMYENLVYALDIEPPKEDLEKVVKLAKCEFIREFEKGLETEIGERGVRLSGGQKQRLAIAKIMLKNPNIILLDEPTSALDSFNEELINIALHNLFKGKTVIVVAHRLQTVKQADRILLFEQGKILEEGTHNELVKLNGKYKKMLDLQSGF